MAWASGGDDGFRVFQDAAPEFVRLEVEEVRVGGTSGVFGSNRTRVEARGRVIEVVWSASGLTPGAVVELRYDHRARGGAAAETPEILEPGRVVPAFLERRGGYYAPAARHHSFSEPTEAQWRKYELARVQAREAALAAAAIRPAEWESGRGRQAAQEQTAVPAAPVAELREEVKPVERAEEELALPRADEPVPPVVPAVEAIEVPVIETEAAAVPGRAAAPGEVEIAAGGGEVTVAEVVEPITPQVVEVKPAPEPASAPAATAREARMPAMESPAAREGYSAVYLLIKKGEAAQLEGRRTEAKEAYVLAREKLLALKAAQPDFQPFMVDYRLKDLKRRLEDLEAAERRNP